MRKLGIFLKKDWAAALCVSVSWQVLMFIIGVAIAPQQGLFGHMNHWDAGWYLHIIQNAYGLEGSPAAPAFYPLFPFIISGLVFISFGIISPFIIALFVNTVALWAIVIALIKILKHFKAPALGIVLSIFAFLAFPSAFFLHVFYSEAVFIAIAFWAYYFALTKKWWAVGTLLAVLTATRLPSFLFVALCGLEYLRSYDWNVKKSINRNILWFFLAPLGFIAYGLYLFIVRGNFFAMFQAYSSTNDWVYQVFNINIFATLIDSVLKIFSSLILSHLNYEIFINFALPLLSIIVLIIASIGVLYKLRRNGLPLFIFGILSVILFTLNSNIISVHRYVLACIVIYIAIGIYSRKEAVRSVVAFCILSGVAIQIFLYSKFITNIFAG